MTTKQMIKEYVDDHFNNFGFYLPNNHELKKAQINYIKESEKEVW